MKLNLEILNREINLADDTARAGHCEKRGTELCVFNLNKGIPPTYLCGKCPIAMGSTSEILRVAKAEGFCFDGKKRN